VWTKIGQCLEDSSNHCPFFVRVENPWGQGRAGQGGQGRAGVGAICLTNRGKACQGDQGRAGH